jgi:hypothetical protein
MSYARTTMIYPGESSLVSQEESAPEETQVALGRWSGGRRSKARMQKLENSRPKLGRMEETLKEAEAHPGL